MEPHALFMHRALEKFCPLDFLFRVFQNTLYHTRCISPYAETNHETRPSTFPPGDLRTLDATLPEACRRWKNPFLWGVFLFLEISQSHREQDLDCTEGDPKVLDQPWPGLLTCVLERYRDEVAMCRVEILVWCSLVIQWILANMFGCTMNYWLRCFSHKTLSTTPRFPKNAAIMCFFVERDFQTSTAVFWSTKSYTLLSDFFGTS